MAHGGKREGAGRKSTGREKTVLYITEQEATICRMMIDQMRLNKPTEFEKHQPKTNLIEEQTEFEFDKQESQEQTNLLEEVEKLQKEILELKEGYEYDLSVLKTHYKNEIMMLNSQHEGAIYELETKYEDEICNLKYENENEIAELKSEHEEEIQELKIKFKEEISEIKSEYEEEIVELKSDFENEISTLQSQLESECENENVSEQIEVVTIATDERIMELKNLGKVNREIAEILNQNNELTEKGFLWTTENVKKRIRKIKLNQEGVQEDVSE